VAVALGVTLYEMVTGHLPFRSDDELALIRAHIHEPPPPPRSVDAAIAPALDELILRALRKAPAERFASAQAMVDAIDGLLAPPKRERRWPWVALWRLLAR